MKNRNLSFDFIRTTCTIGILVAHYNYYIVTWVIGDQTPVFAHTFASCDVPSLAVSCFFILSGASLMYGVLLREETSFSLKSYFISRVKAIYPCFYCVWFIFYLFSKLSGKLVCTEPWKIIFTIAGIDGWAGQFTGTNYYLTGEWFLGTVIFLYILFPFYLKLLQKNLPLLLCVVTVLFFIGMQCGYIGLNFYESPLARSVEFVFGMIFTKVISSTPPPAHVRVCIGVLALCVLGVFVYKSVNLHVMARIILSGISAFIVLYYVGIYAVKIPFVEKFVKWFSAISYPFYLLHHTLLAHISSPFFGNTTLGTARKYFIVFTAFCTIMVVAVVVKQFVSWCVHHGTAVLVERNKIQER